MSKKPRKVEEPIECFNGVELYDAMIGIAEKRIDKAGLAAVFRRYLSLSS